MTPDEAIHEAEQGQLRPVYLVAGEEPFLQAQVIGVLRRAALDGSVPGLNADVFSAAEVAAEAALAVARTLPMMAARRWVLVRSVERWEGSEKKSSGMDALLTYLKDPSPSTVLLLVAGKLDKRRKLYASARKGGWLVGCEQLKRNELPLWIKRTAAQRGNPLASGVAELLAELSGPELGSVADALERVCLYVGPGTTVSEEAVGDCVAQVRPATVWQLVDALGRRDAGKALAVLDRAFDPNEAVRTVGALAWSARQLLKYESARRTGLSPPQAAEAAGAAPFRARELEAQTKSLGRARIEPWVEILARLDRDLKGGSKRPPKATLEHALLNLCR